MTNQHIEVELVGVDQAGRMTGMSAWTWRRYAYEGKVASVKIGTRLLIPRKSILAYIAERTRPALDVQAVSGGLVA